MEKKIMISIVVIVLFIALGGIWFFPTSNPESFDNAEMTGKVVIDAESETNEETEIVTENSELEGLDIDELLQECLNKCGKEVDSGFEASIWVNMCKKKQDLGEDALRDFVKTC